MSVFYCIQNVAYIRMVLYYNYSSYELTVAPVRMYTKIYAFHHKQKRPDLRDGSFLYTKSLLLLNGYYPITLTRNVKGILTGSFDRYYFRTSGLPT